MTHVIDMIQETAHDSHVSQGAPPLASWVVEVPPTPSRACTCLGELRELPAGPNHMITVGNTGVIPIKFHQYPPNQLQRREGLGRDELCAADRSEQLVVSRRHPLNRPGYTNAARPPPLAEQINSAAHPLSSPSHMSPARFSPHVTCLVLYACMRVAQPINLG